jgi:N-acylglucosamine-6-phosphate 2-epimerase
MDREESKRIRPIAPLLERLRGGVIVSCQAPEDSPLNDPSVISAMALAAQRQGAVGVRINGPENIRATRARVSIPIIGIHKVVIPPSPVYITPTREIAEHLRDCGADIIALDATLRPRPDGLSIEQLLAELRGTLGIPIMADIAREEESLVAARTGTVDLIATTLAGYTEESLGTPLPALDLVERLVHSLREFGPLPVICEGGIETPAQVARCFTLGAFAVVVGTAITGIEPLARRFTAAAPRPSS